MVAARVFLDSIKVFWKKLTGRFHPCLKKLLVPSFPVLRKNIVVILQHDLHSVILLV